MIREIAWVFGIFIILCFLFAIFFFIASILLNMVGYYYTHEPLLTCVPVLVMAIITFIFWLFVVLILIVVANGSEQSRIYNNSYW